jgi:formylglycine-generating enzyme required for sulfatase activity
VFLPLNRYRPYRPGETLPAPEEWLAQEWKRSYPGLPEFPELLQTERVLLLLDAVNEMPHAGEADYRERIARWKDFLADLASRAPGTRAVFSCRSLDYSAPLSTPELPVPHVRIERLADEQVEEFLTVYNAELGPALWRRLRGTPQLDLFRSPFYLRLLLDQTERDGSPPEGRSALFTGFVRRALSREVEADNRLFRPGALLDARDHDRIVRREWRDPYDLPARGPAIPALSRLAFGLQARRGVGDVSRVRARYDEALALLGGDRAEDLLRAGVSLQVLEEERDDVFFAHQLIQEYFAARTLAAAPRPELVRTAWRAAEISPSLEEILRTLPDSDPLPQAPVTGWEETFVLAASMVREPDAVVATLAELNLPLAGRCAAVPDVAISPSLRQRLNQGLIARSRDPVADLRARIAAARALGELGDPRFERHQGPDSEYLLPPTVAIKGGDYPIGSDEGLYEDEAPVHAVTLAPFALGRFPVTNAEWRLFLGSGGYEDERWWDTAAARAWRRGETTAEGPKQEWRKLRQRLQANPGHLRDWHRAGRLTSQQMDQWEGYIRKSDADFEATLEQLYPVGRQTRPMTWDDPAFNHPAQPVVGISWYEARAYCRWLSAQSGQPYRLPTEAEWEAAARGPEGRNYAWPGEFDPKRCNAFETHVRGTTPPGVFPGGDTPEGLVDMTGNVWEWSSSCHQPYRYHPDDGREDPENAEARRVVRGGAWFRNRASARCAYRSAYHPDDRGSYLGFRVALVSPIP